jgi:hypothetical protein
MMERQMFLTSSLARQTAEARWGRGGTAAYKTNRKGAYYFSCSGHGGFVISAKALSAAEYEAISKYVTPEVMTVYVDDFDNQVLLVYHPFRRNTGKLRSYSRGGYRVEKEEIFLLEEDCEWALAVKFAGIMTKDMTKEAAEKTFYNWHDENNPVVVARARVANLRELRDSNLIVAASSMKDDLVKVWTADDKTHVVKGYNMARDEFGTPWLSRCVYVEMLEAS